MSIPSGATSMQPADVVTHFDQQAPGYDQQWSKLSALRECLYLLLDSLLEPLPSDARVLCVGVGTGLEMAHLAHRFPQWQFTAVEPSGAMLDVCRERAKDEGFAERCRFHHGFLDSLPIETEYHAATSILVSQFIVDRDARTEFFADIASRLSPNGVLVSADLASDTHSPAYDVLLPAWLRAMAAADVTAEAIERIREAYSRDVAVLPEAEVAAIIEAGGFLHPTRFFQAGLIHGWICARTP